MRHKGSSWFKVVGIVLMLVMGTFMLWQVKKSIEGIALKKTHDVKLVNNF